MMTLLVGFHDKTVMEWDVQRVWRGERRWTHSRRRRDEDVTRRRDPIRGVERERNFKRTASHASFAVSYYSFPFFLLCLCRLPAMMSSSNFRGPRAHTWHSLRPLPYSLCYLPNPIIIDPGVSASSSVLHMRHIVHLSFLFFFVDWPRL